MRTETLIAGFWSGIVAIAAASFLGAASVWIVPPREQTTTHANDAKVEVANVTQTVTLPQSAADSRSDPQIAARVRGGYTTNEVASMLGMSTREIQDRCLKGEIICVRGSNGHYLIPLECFE